MKLHSLTSFAALLGTIGADMHHANHVALDHAGRIVRDEARRVLGTYDYNWSPLSARTIARKGTDNPGIETGEMRDNTNYRADEHSAEIGSDLDKAVWFELGTSRQPPRSYLAGAFQHQRAHVVDAIGRVIVGHLSGQQIALLPGQQRIPVPRPRH
jgi:hypothetical protein